MAAKKTVEMDDALEGAAKQVGKLADIVRRYRIDINCQDSPELSH